MKRRRILAGVAGLATVGGAGCLAGDRDSPGGNADETTTRDDESTTTDDPTTTSGDSTTDAATTTTTDDGLGWDPSSRTPFESATVGSREGVPFADNNRPHSTRVWNDADEGREIDLTLRADGDVVFEESYRFPADGWLDLTLNEPANYLLTLAVDGECACTVTVDRDQFDCNASQTNVAVGADGTVDSTTVSTAVACPGPTVAGQSFVRSESGCGSDESAAATFGDGAVHVTGGVRTPNPCYDLALSDVSLRRAEQFGDGEDDVLVLEVTTDGQRDGLCVQCVGVVDYVATVEFENEYPSAVRVVHESTGDRRTVLETGR